MTERQELESWKDRIRQGIAAQRKYGESDKWTDYENYYLGKHNTRSSLKVNYMFALARAMTPQVYFRNPRIVVVPRRQESETGAPVQEAVDNWLIQEMGLKGQLKGAALDNFLYGIWIAKIGYDSEYGFQPEQQLGPVITPEGVADLSDETLTQRADDFGKIEYNNLVQPGMPWCLRWHPRDFVIEPGATGVHDAQWCAFRALRRLRDIKSDPKYKNTGDLKTSYSEEFAKRDQERLVAGEPNPKEAMTDYGQHKTAKDDEWVELWEVRDAKYQEKWVICLNHDQYLVRQFDDEQVDGLPVIVASFNKNPSSFWGVPDAKDLVPLQDELNMVRWLQEQYRKHNLRRYITRENTFTIEEEQKFFADAPVAFLKTKFEATSLNDVVKELQGFMPPDLNAWSEQIRMDMREIIGFGRNQLGEYDRGMQGGSARRTATEAGIVQQNAQIRIDERRDMMADALSQIMRRVNQMTWKFWTKERVIRVVGQQGATWQTYTGTALRGEYDYLIEPDDALPMTRERRRQESLMLYQALAQNPLANQPELIRHLVKQFEGANPDLLVLQPQGMPGMPPGMPPGMGPPGMGPGMMGQGMPQGAAGQSANIRLPLS